MSYEDACQHTHVQCAVVCVRAKSILKSVCNVRAFGRAMYDHIFAHHKAVSSTLWRTFCRLPCSLVQKSVFEEFLMGIASISLKSDFSSKISSLHRGEEYRKRIWIYLKFYTSLWCLVFFPAASTSMMHGASYIVHYTIKPIYRQRQFCPSRPMTLDDFSSFYSSTIKARSLETNTIKSKAPCIAKTSKK